MCPPFKAGRGRGFRTAAPIVNVEPLDVVMADEVFASRDALRVWLKSATALAGLTPVVGRHLNSRMAFVAGSEISRQPARRTTNWGRFAVDGILTPATIRDCREFIAWMGGYENLEGGTLVAPFFGFDVRRFIDDHTRATSSVPVLAVQYTFMRDPASSGFAALLRVVAGFSALRKRSSPASARQAFWASVAEALERRGEKNYELTMNRTGSLRIRVLLRRYVTVQISALIRFRRLMVGVVVPMLGVHGRANADRIAGRLSLPVLPAPERISKAEYEAQYFTISDQLPRTARAVPDVDPDAVAEMLLQLRQQTVEILADRKDG